MYGNICTTNLPAPAVFNFRNQNKDLLIFYSYLLKNSVPGSNLMGFYPFIAGSVFRFLFLLNVNSRRIQEGKICGGKQEKCKENGRKL